MNDDTNQPPPVVIIINAKTGVQARIQMEQLLGNYISQQAKVVPAVSDASADKYTPAEVLAVNNENVAALNAPTAKRTEASLTTEGRAANKTGRRGKARAVDAQPASALPAASELVPSLPVTDPKLNPYETAALAEQDAADEAAETAKAEDAPLTLDDVRNAVKPYIDKWTIAVAQADVGPLIKDIGGADKISELDPANQENLKKLVAALNAASASPTRYVKAA